MGYDDRYPGDLELFDRVGVYGSLTDSKIHHNYIGACESLESFYKIVCLRIQCVPQLVTWFRYMTPLPDAKAIVHEWNQNMNTLPASPHRLLWDEGLFRVEWQRDLQ